MGGRAHEFAVTLKRNNSHTPWGFSLVGGADVNTPLIITKVAFGSPSDGVLQRGDIITKVGNYDSRDIRHQDAQTLFKNAGDNVRIVVQREQNPGRHNTSTGSSRSSSRNYSSPLSVSPHMSPRGGIGSTASQYSPAGSALTPTYGAPFEVMHEGFYQLIPDVRVPRKHTGNLDVHVENQVVHKQFNSPIGLYSDANIADTLQRQTGASVSRRPMKYDPSKSETFRALQEEHLDGHVQESVASPSKVFVPNKAIPGKKPHNPGQYQPQQNDVNSLGAAAENIQQSHSFKRLMWSVLPETDY